MGIDVGMGRVGTFAIGERHVNRLGFGAMRLTGSGIWGPPRDPEGCVAVLRRAVEFGVELIDTADSYGPHVSEELIARALHPYPEQLLIATKAGLVRTGPGGWHLLGRPEYLRQQCELSLRRLRLERIDLFQLHRIDPTVPAEDQFGVLADLRAEGKIGEVGLSEISVAELEAARGIVPIATVQNRYNLVDRGSEELLEHCEREGIGFMPWFPIASGDLAAPGGRLDAVVMATGATPAQVALAWLLARSPVMLPIPGTANVDHLEENCRAAAVELSPAQVTQLSQVAGS
jgi:aryl-alcohol dehydrogenase-like predicted oxidoreductase